MKILAALLFLAATAWGAMPWQLTTADLSTQGVNVRKMDSTGLDFLDNNGTSHHLAINQLVAMQRNQPTKLSTDGYILIQSDGQRWTGRAERMDGDQIVWRTPLFGELSSHLSRTIRIIRQDNSVSTHASNNEDIIHLANGDVVHGAISSITGQQVVLQTTSASTPISWSAITEIDFASLGNASATTQPDSGWQIDLDDGSIVHASAIDWSGNVAQLTLVAGQRSLPSSHIISIEQLNGPVRFLAEQEPSENVQIPLLGAPWPAKFGMDLNGNPLPQAISVHAYSRLTWAAPGNFKTFHVQYAIPAELSLADVTVRIQMDGKTVYEQSHLHGGTFAAPIDLPLNHARQLVLEVDSSNPYRTQGWLTWISPALLR